MAQMGVNTRQYGGNSQPNTDSGPSTNDPIDELNRSAKQTIELMHASSIASSQIANYQIQSTRESGLKAMLIQAVNDSIKSAKGAVKDVGDAGAKSQ